MNEKPQTIADQSSIDLSVIFTILRKYIVVIIIGGILGGGVSYFYTKYFIPPRYMASATVIVNNRASDSQYIYPSEMSTSRNLAQLYSIIIKSDTVLENVINDLNLNITYEQLKNCVSVNVIDNTQVVEISVTSTSPDFALNVAEKFVEYSKPMIIEKVEAGSVKDLNEPAMINGGAPISPNRRKNTINGVAVGLIIVVAIVFFKEYLDTKIRTEADAVAALDVPVLGVIPLIDRKEFHK